MSVQTEKYIEQAKFIDSEEDLDSDWWPRNPLRYTPTDNWRQRMRRLSGIVESEDVEKAIEECSVHPAANGNAAFVNDLGGLVIYVVVDSELMKRADKYPNKPLKSDYKFKGVTVWPYIYDLEEAKDTGRWSVRELEVVEQINKENQEFGV